MTCGKLYNIIVLNKVLYIASVLSDCDLHLISDGDFLVIGGVIISQSQNLTFPNWGTPRSEVDHYKAFRKKTVLSLPKTPWTHAKTVLESKFWEF